MAEFNLNLDMRDDAMQHPGQLARMLREVAERVEYLDAGCRDDGPLVDGNGNTIGRWAIEQGQVEIKDCPACHAADSLETHLRIDLNDVVVDDGRVVAFTLAGSANDRSNGIVVDEARVTCRDCGHEVEAIVPLSITEHWSYRP